VDGPREMIHGSRVSPRRQRLPRSSPNLKRLRSADEIPTQTVRGAARCRNRAMEQRYFGRSSSHAGQSLPRSHLPHVQRTTTHPALMNHDDLTRARRPAPISWENLPASEIYFALHQLIFSLAIRKRGGVPQGSGLGPAETRQRCRPPAGARRHGATRRALDAASLPSRAGPAENGQRPGGDPGISHL
jgi:hypothetical protein